MSDSDQVGPPMIGALVSIIDHELRRRVTAALQTQGFVDYRSTYHEIFMLLRADGSRITELAERAQITRQAMSELIAELERRGYVERQPDPTDRRAVLVRRTERGWQVNVIAREVVQAAQQDWMAQVGEREYDDLLTALRQIVALIAPPPAGVAGHLRARGPAHPPVRSHRSAPAESAVSGGDPQQHQDQHIDQHQGHEQDP